MHITYDETADALYARMAADEVQISKTQEFDAGTLVDADHRGHLVGIEVLRPARDWPLKQLIMAFEMSKSDALVLSSLWKGRKEMHRGAASRTRAERASTAAVRDAAGLRKRRTAPVEGSKHRLIPVPEGAEKTEI